MTCRNHWLAVFVVLFLVRPCTAQPSGPQRCEADANRRKAAWATSAHSWFANDWELETRELQLDSCRAAESRGEEKMHNGENFGRVLFTGDGIHPVVGTIAPGNGLAGGVSLAHAVASQSRPLRFNTMAEARASINGSWKAGAEMNVLGSAPSSSKAHANAILGVEHWHVNEVSFFGVGRQSASDETRFGLDRTSARFTVESTGFHGVTIFGQTEALHARPLAFTGSSALSIEQRFVDAAAPALATATAYAVAGGGVNWKYPQDEISSGYSTGISAAFRRYQEVAGRPYSFSRTDVTWTNQYTPGGDIDLGTVSASARIVASLVSTDRVPFYLQPTLGGTDITNEGGLRSYHDYRFRAPDLAAAQFEYTRVLKDPFGFLAFLDVGTVGQQLSDLQASDLKHSVGIGITFRIGNLVFAQFYYAWGGSEGSRGSFSGNSNALAPNGAIRGIF